MFSEMLDAIELYEANRRLYTIENMHACVVSSVRLASYVWVNGRIVQPTREVSTTHNRRAEVMSLFILALEHNETNCQSCLYRIAYHIRVLEQSRAMFPFVWAQRYQEQNNG